MWIIYNTEYIYRSGQSFRTQRASLLYDGKSYPRELQVFQSIEVCAILKDFLTTRHDTIEVPVAPVAYQVILEPGMGQFREFEPPRVHTRMDSRGLFLMHKLTCRKRESVSEQHSMKNRRAVGSLNPMRDKKLRQEPEWGGGTTPVTTAYPGAGK